MSFVSWRSRNLEGDDLKISNVLQFFEQYMKCSTTQVKIANSNHSAKHLSANGCSNIFQIPNQIFIPFDDGRETRNAESRK